MPQDPISPEDIRMASQTAYRQLGFLDARTRLNVIDTHVADGRKLHAEIAQLYPPGPDEFVIDVGGSDGYFLAPIAKDPNFHGRLMVVDIDWETLRYGRSSFNESLDVHTPIEYVVGSADHLPLVPNHSVDRIYCNFVLPSVPYPEEALAEFARLLKPGAKAIIALDGEDNKHKHRQYEEFYALNLNILPPVVVSRYFTWEHAQSVLPRYFQRVVAAEPQIGEMVFTKDDYQDYLLSLHSKRKSFRPEVEDGPGWLTAEREVEEDILRKIRQNGSFTDRVSRNYFVCWNDVIVEAT